MNTLSKDSADNSKMNSPSAFTQDNHVLAVIKFGTGQDDQGHVQLPIVSQQRPLNNLKSNRNNQQSTKILNRNRSELEPIQERVKEEDFNNLNVSMGSK